MSNGVPGPGDVLPIPNDRAWHLRQILAPGAWDIGATGAGVRIGHLDTGVRRETPELRGANILAGYDVIRRQPGGDDPLVRVNPWDPGELPGHGTATASVIVSPGGVTPWPPPPSVNGGTTAPGVITGIAQRVALDPYRVISSVVLIQSGTVASGIAMAVDQGCDVITMSLGGLPSVPLFLAVRNAVLLDRIVVAAAGNYSPFVVYPAALEDCIAVAGTNVAGLPYLYSSRGPEVDIAAPAERVWVSGPGGPGAGSGTSFATPCVASIAALWLSVNGGREAVVALKPPGSLLQSMFRSLLRSTALPWPGALEPLGMGAGIVNAAALAAARPPSAPPFVSPSPPAAKAATQGATSPARRAVDVGRMLFDSLTRMLRAEDGVAWTQVRALFSRSRHVPTDQELERLVERYGLELLHILMAVPEALELLRSSGALLAKGSARQAGQVFQAALDAIRAKASKTLASVLAVRAPAAGEPEVEVQPGPGAGTPAESPGPMMV